jgi:hypothetical protein
MPRLAWGGAGAHSLGVGGRLVETDARTLHLLAYSDLTWMDLLRAALVARSIPGNHSVAKQKLWVGCASMFYARIPS